MNHIFISHSHEDSDFAENMQNKLEQAGFTVWRDIGIRGGEDWRKEIDQAIKEAFVLIVVVTPAAKASEYVTYEWAFASGAGVKVIPILHKKTDLHPRLEALQYLDFTIRNVRPWDTLFDLLRTAESSKPQGERLGKPDEIKIANINERGPYERMMEAFKGNRWRSIEKLAIIGGVSESEALDILRRDPNVDLSRGRSGHMIAKLKVK
jgi:hypothetical protein